MATEIFLVEEIEQLITENEHIDEWKKSVEEAGLEGQLKLCKKSPIPFVFMNEAMIRVYKTLCPDKSAVEEYSKSTIPLRVVSIILLAKKENYFDNIEVWYDNKSPDPIVVGVIKQKDNSSYDYYLIARWGDELKDFPTLRKEAMERWKRERLAKWETEFSELKYKIDNVDLLAQKYFISLEWVW